MSFNPSSKEISDKNEHESHLFNNSYAIGLTACPTIESVWQQGMYKSSICILVQSRLRVVKPRAVNVMEKSISVWKFSNFSEIRTINEETSALGTPNIKTRLTCF
eukprot:NODE_424_length_8864_cov_0.190188.p8 type:complete len:105 gc:universal NODE_424_length_8864_cov_0.190188:6955-7269(+)